MAWEKQEGNVFVFAFEGDTCEGTLLKRELGRYGNEVYLLKTKDKTWTVFSTAVMESRMTGVEIGEQVKIVYLGTQPSKTKGHQDVKLFDVFVDR